MPLTRYQIKNEYGLADPEVYRSADKEDPEALLEGVAMAGLVGLLRQLGDLAEFAAEIFHDLHEEVMATSARGHGLMVRIQQLEAEFPPIEKALLSQTNHSQYYSNAGIDWHPNLQMEKNLIAGGDLPRFVMDSYEESRGPPRLFLLDKFDVAGAGACLKRYTDPSFFKVETVPSKLPATEGQWEKRVRETKRKGACWRNGETPEALPASHAKLHQLFMEERIENAYNDPTRRVNLKRRPLDGFPFDSKGGKSYMEKFVESSSPESKTICEVPVVPLSLKWKRDDTSEPEVVELRTISPVKDVPQATGRISSPNIREKQFMDDLGDFEPTINGDRDEVPYTSHAAVKEKDLSFNGNENREGSVNGYNNEAEKYIDAIASVKSEIGTDSGSRCEHNTNEDGRLRQSLEAFDDAICDPRDASQSLSSASCESTCTPLCDGSRSSMGSEQDELLSHRTTSGDVPKKTEGDNLDSMDMEHFSDKLELTYGSGSGNEVPNTGDLDESCNGMLSRLDSPQSRLAFEEQHHPSLHSGEDEHADDTFSSTSLPRDSDDEKASGTDDEVNGAMPAPEIDSEKSVVCAQEQRVNSVDLHHKGGDEVVDLTLDGENIDSLANNIEPDVLRAGTDAGSNAVDPTLMKVGLEDTSATIDESLVIVEDQHWLDETEKATLHEEDPAVVDTQEKGRSCNKVIQDRQDTDSVTITVHVVPSGYDDSMSDDSVTWEGQAECVGNPRASFADGGVVPQEREDSHEAESSSWVKESGVDEKANGVEVPGADLDSTVGVSGARTDSKLGVVDCTLLRNENDVSSQSSLLANCAEAASEESLKLAVDEPAVDLHLEDDNILNQEKEEGSSVEVLENFLIQQPSLMDSLDGQTFNTEVHHFGLLHQGEEINLSEMPPLPPLPPLQWRVGKPQNVDVPSTGETKFPGFGLGHFPPLQPSIAEENPLSRDTFSPEVSRNDNPVEPSYNLQKPQVDGESGINSNDNELKPLSKASEQYSVASDTKMMQDSLLLQSVKGDLTSSQHPGSPEGELVQTVDQSLLKTDTEVKHLQQLTEEDSSDPTDKRDEPLNHLKSMEARVESTDPWALSPFTGSGKTNGTLMGKVPRPPKPLIEAVAAHDRSKLRKAAERARPQLAPKLEERDSMLEQIRTKSFNLKPTTLSRRSIQHGPQTNLKVAAILEKANAIRQALAGSVEDDGSDSWSE